jgi:hypothetical protein
MVSGGDFEGILALAGAIHGGFGSAWSSAARSTQHATRNTTTTTAKPLSYTNT